jgi:predicted nucleic acid-binding protein
VAVLFFDSSAIAKRYADEIGSAWVISITDPAAGNITYLTRITEVEVVSAITRRAREGRISASDAATGIALFRYDFSHH